MTIEFDFVQDFRKYREYITFVTKVDDAMDMLPFNFYQGDGSDVYIVERKGNKLTVVLTDKTDPLVDKFKELAQPDTFNDVPEGVAYLYDINTHELIFNFDERTPSATWNWSHYPATFWIPEDQKWDHGIMLDQHGKVHRIYLSNKKLVSLFVGMSDLNNLISDVWVEDQTKLQPEPVGVHLVLSILADQLGQEVPRPVDTKTAIACDLVNPKYPKRRSYDVQDLTLLFDMADFDEELEWEQQWGAALADAMFRDEQKDVDIVTTPPTSYQNQLCVTELLELPEVPEADKPTYVHMDVPIHGVHYALINPGQRLCIWYDDLIISANDIKEMLANLPDEQFEFYPEYGTLDDGTEVH